MGVSWRTATSVPLQLLLYSLVAGGLYYYFSNTPLLGAISLGLGAGLTMTLVLYWLDKNK